MSTDRITLVIPTVGRPSLLRTLASVRHQEGPDGTADEVLLIADGPCPGIRTLWDQFGLPGRLIELPNRLGFFGHGARNWVNHTRAATGDYLMALDDDDILAPTAVAHVRQAIAEEPERPLLFRMQAPDGRLVWDVPEIRYANVATPMIVTPNDPARLGTWQPRYGGDHAFIVETLAHYPDGPVWRPEVICRVRPHEARPVGREKRLVEASR